MEDQSAPEQFLPQTTERTVVRLPGLEFTMGLALFAIVFMVFFLVQTGVFMAGVLERTPEFASEGFSFGLLTNENFRLRMDELLYNGDLVARQALWSGLAGSLIILASVWLWKRHEAAEFLGLRLVHIKRYLPWTALFILLALVIEGLGYLSPAFRTDFMVKVLGSSTNLPLLLLGVGIMAPVFEELLLRGLLLGSIRNIADEHASIFVTAGIFTAMHLQYSWSVMLLIMPMGILLGYARTRSGSILVPVLLHVLNNSLSVLWG